MLEQAYRVFRANYSRDKMEKIKTLNEMEYQDGFLRDIFVDVFGYTLKPTENFNLVREQKNQTDAKKADAAIVIDQNVVAVIELKSCRTKDLSSSAQQAFGYKNNHKNCQYVVVSNFQKLRFYMDYAGEYEEFDLFHLQREEFDFLHLILSKESIFNEIPITLKNETRFHEQEITHQLYNDYSNFKYKIFNNLVKRNPKIEPLVLFRKAQKLLDRLLFVFFAEDCGLLPANSISSIIERHERLAADDAYKPLYEIYKQYFGYINTGRKGKTPADDIAEFNGGLFAPDKLLDSLKIDDKILKTDCLKLSAYDFSTEVDVNILGHIFEQSINEMEEMEKNAQSVERIGYLSEISKRKKDGIFYTPKYITQYIVDNTIGTLCTQKRKEMQIYDIEFDANLKSAKGLTTKGKELFLRLADYKNWLQGLKILDPACGSGAFLNQALQFLLAEHRAIDSLMAELEDNTDKLLLHNTDKVIIENNLFGVDINEESVEIAQLSLWLRTAQKGRKLSHLSNNIKCGNSLIDTPKSTEYKAFDWKKEFKEIMKGGGFDVVIGNPPYVRLESVKQMSENLSKMNFQTFEKRGDLYGLFVEQGFKLLKNQGLISYIMPNKWLQAGYGKPLRDFLLSFELIQLIDFGDIQIFEGATTYPCIFVARKSAPQNKLMVSVLKEVEKGDFEASVKKTAEIFETSHFSGETWIISSSKEQLLLERLKARFDSLSQYVGNEVFRGVLTGLTEAFIIDENTKKQLIAHDYKAAELIKPVIRGRNIKPWVANYQQQYLITSFPALNIDIEHYSSIKNYLLSFGIERLEQSGKKGSRKKTSNKWFETQDAIGYHAEFAKPKIMYQVFQVKPCFVFDDKNLFCNNSIWIIPTENKALLALLNSKMGWWLISKFCTQIQNGYQLIWKYLGQIPIAHTNKQLEQKAEVMIELHKEFQIEKNNFLRTLQEEKSIAKISKNIDSFQELEYEMFKKELAKLKVKFALGSENNHWREYFLSAKQKINNIENQILITENETNTLIYQLYELTPSEIEMVEKSVSINT